MAPTFSVIVPTFNEEALLPGTLEHLSRLQGSKEIIVADGGSADRTTDIAARNARLVVSPRGRGIQMNAGVGAAMGRYLLFVHADCELAPDALSQAEMTLSHPGVVAGCFSQRIAGRSFAYRWIEKCADLRASLLQFCLGESGLFLTREAFHRAGGFPDVPLFEDLGMSRRLRALGRIEVAKTRITVSPRRWERRGIVNTTLLNWALTLGYFCGVSEQTLVRFYYGAPHRTMETSRV